MTIAFKLYREWLNEASEHQTDAHAAVLSTISSTLKPRSRVVLLNLLSDNTFTFYTNLESDKANEIVFNNNISLCFFWPQIAKQIRIEGVASILQDEISTEYFNKRAKDKQIGAWSSSQSRLLADRKELDKKYADYSLKFENSSVPKPPYWGGYKVEATYFEFWEMVPGRLHNRKCFKMTNKSWNEYLLYP